MTDELKKQLAIVDAMVIDQLEATTKLLKQDPNKEVSRVGFDMERISGNLLRLLRDVRHAEGNKAPVVT